jgi:hypothetical protein
VSPHGKKITGGGYAFDIRREKKCQQAIRREERFEEKWLGINLDQREMKQSESRHFETI